MNGASASPAPGVAGVLADGGRLFVAGLSSAFPWVLLAELVQAFAVPAGSSSDLLHADLTQLFGTGDVVRAILSGCVQAFLYATAIRRLGDQSDGPSGFTAGKTLRVVFSLLIAYVAYEVVLGAGLILALMFFLLGGMILGILPGLVLTLIPLAPTAAASTALALFAYPVVLEGKGPFAALARSVQLARANWARVTAVISVPALVLFMIWLMGSGWSMLHSVSDTLRQVSAAAGQMDEMQLESLLSTANAPVAGPGMLHRALFAVLEAVGWWYTVAVCYVEYRALRERDTSH